MCTRISNSWSPGRDERRWDDRKPKNNIQQSQERKADPIIMGDGRKSNNNIQQS